MLSRKRKLCDVQMNIESLEILKNEFAEKKVKYETLSMNVEKELSCYKKIRKDIMNDDLEDLMKKTYPEEYVIYSSKDFRQLVDTYKNYLPLQLLNILNLDKLTEVIKELNRQYDLLSKLDELNLVYQHIIHTKE